jgi:hypothetical protein
MNINNPTTPEGATKGVLMDLWTTPGSFDKLRTSSEKGQNQQLQMV